MNTNLVLEVSRGVYELPPILSSCPLMSEPSAWPTAASDKFLLFLSALSSLVKSRVRNIPRLMPGASQVTESQT